MSNEAMGYVWRYSPFKGATLQVHQAVADSVNDQNHNEFWMDQAKLAQKARIDRSTANAALARLLQQGFLELLEEGGGRSRPSRYRFLFPEVAVVFDSREGYSKTVTKSNSSKSQTVESHPETVESHPETVVSGNRHRTQENPREPKRVKSQPSADDLPQFQHFWTAYPRQANGTKPEPKLAKDQWGKLKPAEKIQAMASLPHYIRHLQQNPEISPKHAFRWLRDRSFEGYSAAPLELVQGSAAPLTVEDEARKLVARAQ